MKKKPKYEKGTKFIVKTICTVTQRIATPWCPLTRTQLFLGGKEPKGRCKIHRKLKKGETK